MRGTPVAGIDVGVGSKGYHAVVISDAGVANLTSRAEEEIVAWCLSHGAEVVAVDAPCGWSVSGKSRLAERDLIMSGSKVHCFATPSRAHALEHTRGFYDWVFNAERLYACLAPRFPLYDGTRHARTSCVETFPHAVVCALAGRVVAAGPKSSRRRAVLEGLRIDTSGLTNVDLLDAALCAVAADYFRRDAYRAYGNPEEGFIVVPQGSAINKKTRPLKDGF